MKGIDVSKHNGSIDFNAVKASGVEFVIIRAGYGMYDNQKDPKFEENYAGAKAAGLHVGAYWYSYAKSSREAEVEADVCLRVIGGKQFDFPIYFDIEDPSQSGLGIENITNMVISFCDKVEKNGYFVGVYANTDWFTNRIDRARTDRFTKWLADYRSNYNTTLPRDIHQYTSSGAVPGISGRVDLNNCTRDFPSEILAAGLNGYSSGTALSEVVIEATVRELNVRNTPNVYGAVIGTITKGQGMKVLDDMGGGSWVRVDAFGGGFVARQYTTGANGTDIANDSHVVGMITADGVSLRNLPDKNSPKLATMNRGDLFDVADDRGGDKWIYIRWNHKNGYVARQYTNGANGNNVEGDMPVYLYPPGNYRVVAISLNVRTGPGVEYSVKPLGILSPSAQAHGGYRKGIVFTAKEVRNMPCESWALTPSGWVCIRNSDGVYCKLLD